MKKDIQISKLIQKETKRQKSVINLIASENYVSQAVLEALGSVFTNKYAEGYPGKRYYGGNTVVDEVENLAKERALKLFKLSPKKWAVNVQPYSGSPANLAVYMALVPLHEKIMGMRLDMGGHLTHGHKVSASGKIWEQVPYGVNKKTERLDYRELEAIAKKEKPKLIVAGFTAYPRRIDWASFRRVADSCGAILMVDMSHIAGLVAGGAHPSPFPYADVVTTTVHKTLRGPRSAMIFSRLEYALAIDKAVFPGMQGGPHVNQIAGIATALYEASQPEFKTYAAQIVKNARVLGDELSKKGWRVVSGGTDNHVLLLDTWARGVTGAEASDALEKHGIVVNKNTIPFDERKPMDPSGIRIGTAAVTTQGMKEKDMKRIADRMHAILDEVCLSRTEKKTHDRRL
ncbi:MAG: serine hydroxymethyltransferase [Candidatus Ryanbacteria bacterium RIFCSPHIGHO2_02_FULL_45_17b]|uniref:Serine hydroxymethyltransferase n=1 Tax=Candidatus Ryanbacteria bacterium RIFCSPHIGHO2_01_FULL_45_22 TaxID=1802114 RepID=A0A1G2G1L0_9BACT|nr:MAG: serine hydroxymethyltransferase [Candidatus Ryanbacteria bacterium RIFCSPHIGHO2_01_FULL_45_22]OGZ46487.1 MAG: serine hydroxymethyltransferase [Candidatus Ryanbacteria bacterium RIFCSPHIGHO2_02_FULL_45_17b]